MGPIFEQPSLLPASPGGGVDQRTVIGSESGEGRQVVGADQDIDAVDLMQREPVDGFQPTCGRDFVGTRLAKALGGKSDPPRLGRGKAFLPSSRGSADRLSPEQRPDLRRQRAGHNQHAAESADAVRRSLSKSAPASAANTPSSARMSAASAGGVCAWAKIWIV